MNMLFAILVALPPLFWASPTGIDVDSTVAKANVEMSASLEPAQAGESQLTSELREQMKAETAPVLDIRCIPSKRMPLCN